MSHQSLDQTLDQIADLVTEIRGIADSQGLSEAELLAAVQGIRPEVAKSQVHKPAYVREVVSEVTFPRWHQCERIAGRWGVRMPNGRTQFIGGDEVTSTGKLRRAHTIPVYAHIGKAEKKRQAQAQRHEAGACTCSQAWDCPAVRDGGLTNPHKQA